MKSIQFEKMITAEINKILASVQLSSEMLRSINAALSVDSERVEPFKWAHLTLLSCKCVGGVPEQALSGAIAMEFFALAADIFDDVQDQDNDELPWRKLPNANAVNLATCLLMLGYEALSTISDHGLYKEVSSILIRTGIRASDGQFQEFVYECSEKITLSQYFEVAMSKSGSLTACACHIGAVLGGATKSVAIQLEQFGTNLGIMSQIRNDLNDFSDFLKKKDFVNNTKTLPYVYLLDILKEQPNRFKELIQIAREGVQRFGNEEQNFIKQLAIDEGVVHYCTVMYEIYRQKSLEILWDIHIPEKCKEKMIKLVE